MTAAALGTGIAFLVLGKQQADAASAYSRRADADREVWRSMVDEGDRDLLISYVSFGVAGAAAIATGLILGLENRDDGGFSEPGVTLAPMQRGRRHPSHREVLEAFEAGATTSRQEAAMKYCKATLRLCVQAGLLLLTTLVTAGCFDAGTEPGGCQGACVGEAPLASNQNGVCAGVERVCYTEKCLWIDPDYAQVLTFSDDGYQAAESACDGKDNDCDGVTDEGYTVGQACDQDGGDRCPNGQWVCNQAGDGVVCEGDEPDDLSESCNGVDDDCDGLTDEDFAVGDACDGSDSDECANGRLVCNEAGDGVECSAEDPADLPELCNGLDDDCDGETDEDFPVGEACDGADSDECRNGRQVCNEEGDGVFCADDEPGDIVELCNGVDDDCDGATDEDLEPVLANRQAGVCAGQVRACVAGQWAEPDYTDLQAFAAQEDGFADSGLCDGEDNDCDGATDEGCPGVCVTGETRACGSDEGACTAGTQACVAGQWGSCSGTDGPFAEICDGQDNDCDGETDEDADLRSARRRTAAAGRVYGRRPYLPGGRGLERAGLRGRSVLSRRGGRTGLPGPLRRPGQRLRRHRRRRVRVLRSGRDTTLRLR